MKELFMTFKQSVQRAETEVFIYTTNVLAMSLPSTLR